MMEPLVLAHDTAISAPPLKHHLENWAGHNDARQALAGLLIAMAEGSVPVAQRLAQGHLTGDPTAVIDTNHSGDNQKALDIAAHEHFVEHMRGFSVARILSEEANTVIELDPNGKFDVAMDPIDGSGSIGIGAPLGALFAVFPAGESFLRPGREMIGAAYVSFGHSVDFGFSVGDGVSIATLNPTSGVFHVDTTDIWLKDDATTIAFNASKCKGWLPGLQNYVRDLLQGAKGQRGRDFNMRWIAAAVGDLHRILRRGGVFMYPGDSRPGYEGGFLRLAYEAFPIAYLIEQAGGAATDGTTAILDRTPMHLHDRVPLIFGNRSEVAIVGTYLANHEQKEI
jgi:fructose-1,6-bisphosphatase I